MDSLVATPFADTLPDTSSSAGFTSGSFRNWSSVIRRSEIAMVGLPLALSRIYRNNCQLPGTLIRPRRPVRYSRSSNTGTRRTEADDAESRGTRSQRA